MDDVALLVGPVGDLRPVALPPNTEPLHPSERERYLGWRRRELADLQRERRRRVALRWLRRVLTLGLWWR